jgi:hypothetical protein
MVSMTPRLGASRPFADFYPTTPTYLPGDPGT